ncbi:MAG: aminodeoxychorismate/anthranilate synthase component II [Rhodothermales bacterium]|nr:aminodeoxychorismate/anthranilate synthase component II [Rhodothermales bacterium]
MILVLDNYDSFTYNLVHMVAGGGQKVEVIRNDRIDLDGVRALDPSGILISPGPGRPEDAGITQQLIRELGASTPIFGVCLGHQAIGNVYGAEVTYAPTLMHGKTSPVTHDGKGVFQGVEQGFDATRYHSLVVAGDSIPDALTVTAQTADGIVMGLRHNTHPVEGIQFHPESFMTRVGAQLVANWLLMVQSRSLV